MFNYYFFACIIKFRDFRHVITPSNYRKYIPTGRLLSEAEWRSLGIQMSPGWEHYCIHNPEPYIFLFRRPTKKQESTGMARITQHQTNEV